MKMVIAAMPMLGHIMPLLAIGAPHIREATRSSSLRRATTLPELQRSGLASFPLPTSADMDLSRLEDLFPERASLPLGPPRILFDFERIFLDVMPAQATALRQIWTKSDRISW